MTTPKPTDIPGVGLPQPEPGSVAARIRAQLMIADFGVADVSGKLNIIGGGFQTVPRILLAPGAAPVMPGHAIIATFEVPPDLGTDEFSITLVLEDPTGPLQIPDPITGNSQALRISHVIPSAPLQIPGLPKKTLHSRAQVVLNIAPGLPVQAATLYAWVLEVDGYRTDQWRAEFWVTAEQQGPVLG